MKPLTILWRGPLDSCNYGCRYCPFAKRAATRAGLDADRAALARFSEWVQAAAPRRLSVLVTPWGEALIHAWYREALADWSHLDHVDQVAIQTNGSANMAWTRGADRRRLGLWITWHPTEIALDRFIANLQPLLDGGIRFSVGAVGVRAHIDAIEALRAALPAAVPLWINAQKPAPGYSDADVARLTAVDPRFALTLRAHLSRGRACATGETVIAVDGDGTIRRCHFVAAPIGNLYSDDLGDVLRPRPCPRPRCDCFIGFAHLEHLHLDESYGDGLLARIPIAV